jgi:hypothetical protein
MMECGVCFDIPPGCSHKRVHSVGVWGVLRIWDMPSGSSFAVS